ncbi:FkbM family methyltransferase [Thiocapsa bogorovii]|uniref:FkbM family methyltransferase n=1 Tax=Thiocapsa bogorovii TaxID=521689 RepID=UPI001E558FE3|nr:FkbM family methyltransferase [Thiocapsa bogorovii]UHD15467.1 FkbM family methyltransferase [Thiocapsa bogorovii]
MKSQIGRILNSVARPLGLQVIRHRPDGWRTLKEIGHIDTVIDIGVASGTPLLYEAFPDARLILIDPCAETALLTNECLRGRSTEFLNFAVGSLSGKISINVDKGKLSRTSVLQRTALTERNTEFEERQVEMETLDELLKNYNLGKALLKIDTEGYELEVLKGGVESLNRIKFVLAEVSVSSRFIGSYRFEELINYMSNSGYQVRSILSAPKNNEGTIRYVDALFVRN